MILELLARLLLALLIPLLNPVFTLETVTQVDDYPLYTLHYYGDMDQNLQIVEALATLAADPPVTATTADAPAWGCSLFVAFAGPDGALYGRNFDWEFSPAVLVTYDPPDGYASVAMVDIAYLGYRANAGDLLDMPLEDRTALLAAPALPFDGMNEHGLVVGMAAIPNTRMPYDPDRPTMGSLMIIREALDHARTVDEALALFAAYNLDMTGGPVIHYLIADANGDSALVEFADGEMLVTRNVQPWDMATNFVRATTNRPERQCARYRTLSATLSAQAGDLTPEAALDLLAAVAQGSTQWSIVYEMRGGRVHVVMGRDYDRVYTLPAPVADE